ncbi:MAG: ABC transporter ATP-binding protein [Actinomycetota bacterium]
MIRRLMTVVNDDGALRTCVASWIAVGVLQGIGFVLLVPILRALFDGDTSAAWWWTLAMFGVLVVYAIARYVAQMMSYRAAVGLSRGLFMRLGDKIADLPLGWFGSERVGSIGRLTSKGVIDVMGTPAHMLRPIITAFVTPITVIAIMFFFDWRLALAAAVTGPLAWIVFRWSGSLVREADHANDAAAAEAGGRLVEFAQSQAVLRAYGRTVEGNEILDASLLGYRNTGRSLLIKAVPGLIGFAAVLQVAFVIVLVVGVNLAVGGSIDGAELVALLVLTVRSIEPLIAAADVGGALKMADNSLTRMDELLATATLEEPAAGGAEAMSDHSIELDGVSFGYQADEPVLRDVSVEVPSGSMLAIVGPSGSGKTTIARLIARFWDVDEGAVRIGGGDVRDSTTEALMAQLAIVFQDTYLFTGSVADNLRLANADATDEQLDRVAALARLDEMVERLPDGWQSDVGEGGSRLSGGERQRVSIARALLKDAPIVLLDEATAAIDPANEVAIQNALDELRGQRTIVVIAHRLQTVVNADHIIVLDQGAIAESGTHADLLAQGGRYADFWNERTRAAGWRLTGATK